MSGKDEGRLERGNEIEHSSSINLDRRVKPRFGNTYIHTKNLNLSIEQTTTQPLNNSDQLEDNINQSNISSIDQLATTSRMMYFRGSFTGNLIIYYKFLSSI